MGSAKTVTDSSFDTDVLGSEEPVLVDFWAEWCVPCHMVSPVVEEIGQEKGESLRVAKLNIDENPEVTRRYGVMSIPTLMLFKDGEEKARVVGARASLPLAPTTRAFSSPSLNSMRVGMLITPYRRVTSGFSSMFSLATRRDSPFSWPISSTTGETMWHGTHHSAQKSTSTGSSDFRTRSSKSWSVPSPITANSVPFASLLVVRLGLQEPLRVHGRLAALAGRRHRLTVHAIGDVARGEHTGDVGRGARLVHHDVAAVGELYLAPNQRRVRRVADGDEDA